MGDIRSFQKRYSDSARLLNGWLFFAGISLIILFMAHNVLHKQKKHGKPLISARRFIAESLVTLDRQSGQAARPGADGVDLLRPVRRDGAECHQIRIH